MSMSASYHRLLVRVHGRAFMSQLFVRPHAARSNDSEYPAQRTLFVLNVPPYISAEALATAFTHKGQQPIVRLGTADGTSTQGETRSAHIIFSDAAALKRTLVRKDPLQLPAATGSGSRAPKRPRRAELEESTSKFMEEFEIAERQREIEEEERHNQMDSDGFIVVTRKRKGRHTSTEEASGATVGVASAGFGRNESNEEGANAGRARPKKKKVAAEMPNFYHFQQHERKREQLAKLREKFEQDKQRILRMRADRKFKPAGYTY